MALKSTSSEQFFRFIGWLVHAVAWLSPALDHLH
jgi:hypothetical protein